MCHDVCVCVYNDKPTEVEVTDGEVHVQRVGDARVEVGAAAHAHVRVQGAPVLAQVEPAPRRPRVRPHLRVALVLQELDTEKNTGFVDDKRCVKDADLVC